MQTSIFTLRLSNLPETNISSKRDKVHLVSLAKQQAPPVHLVEGESRGILLLLSFMHANKSDYEIVRNCNFL